MKCDDIKTKEEIMAKYDLKKSALNALVAECELNERLVERLLE